MKNFWILLIITITLSGCSSNEPSLIIEDFNPLSNFNTDTSKTQDLFLDYSNSIDSGFMIPSAQQIAGGYFKYTFKAKNNTGKDAEFFFKLYYQNESYAFSLYNDKGKENPLCSENFYGSDEHTDIGFISTGIIPADDQFHEISGQFRIVGNPRNEQNFFGTDPRDKYFTQRAIQKYIDAINATPEWIDAVKKKAVEGGVSTEEQVLADAQYSALMDREKDIANQRWKRNPRTGKYSFMLVVVDPETMQTIPDYIQNISKTNENKRFVNPYFYFKSQDPNNSKVILKQANNLIYVKARPEFANGIYINKSEFPLDYKMNSESFNPTCSNDSIKYHQANFQQFFHKVDPNEVFYNINQISDVHGDAYTMEDYKKNALADKDSRVKSNISITDCPCKTVGLDSAGAIYMKNPASVKDRMRKENVGIMTRQGLSYGKYRVKVQLPSLLNKHQVWNGITNAIWMIGQTSEEWNNRRICTNKGYIPKTEYGPDAKRLSTMPYTEIDFEILKANRYWPSTSYPDQIVTPKETAEDANKIVVTCTNWDMACPEPPLYNIGYYEFEKDGVKWGLHRWDHWYQAITEKYSTEDIFDNPYYYFEIEWKPEEIIWRIGPEKDQLKMVGYMNQTVTSIPNNQMLLVFTQEYHVGRWWPESSQPQENIPFPAQEITGKILEIEIE
ncbi:MAG: hypothetical protein CVU05_05215 [Bacteroidetes bacterium HGW-Bacteroidetes-21]|nr:MAG: hypothetical protein CVU05_05215 [Bacteroidetes bacterium HGW-Bacteroidetes-21]